MGCCFTKEHLENVNETQTLADHHHQHPHPPNAHQKNDLREPTVSEKRRKAAEAAEARQADWRQGGSTDPEKAKQLKMRREKEELLGKIHTKYQSLGKEVPIGLPSCDVDQLKRHLASLK